MAVKIKLTIGCKAEASHNKLNVITFLPFIDTVALHTHLLNIP
jgi:hypothetical protein